MAKKTNLKMEQNQTAYNGKCAVFGYLDNQLEFGGLFDNENLATEFIVKTMSDMYEAYFDEEEHNMSFEDYIYSFFTGKREGNILDEWLDTDNDEYLNIWQISKV